MRQIDIYLRSQKHDYKFLIVPCAADRLFKQEPGKNTWHLIASFEEITFKYLFNMYTVFFARLVLLIGLNYLDI